MKKPLHKSLFVDFSLLKSNRKFLAVFIARSISLFGLGMLAVALPMQVYDLTHDSLQVGLVMALDGVGMFTGLLYGGVLADRYDRKKLILFARSICGLGYLGLAVNALLPQPALWAIYFFSLWDGFFGALGVTALLACMPDIVGRKNLMQARAISMAAMRLVTISAPALGGLLIAASGVSWNYLIAAIGTGLTLIPLLSLPSMLPPPVEQRHPLLELAEAFRFLLQNKIVGGVVAVGTLLTLTSAVRVLFPQLAEGTYGGGAFELGLMYSAVPLGATLGALISAWATRLAQPGLAMMAICLASFCCLIALGVLPFFWVALSILVVFGYLSSIANLLQYSLVQGHTPDKYLGRINGIWTAQDACGDSLGTLGVGVMSKLLAALNSIFLLGTGALTLGVVLVVYAKTLRRAPLNNPELVEIGRAAAN